MTSSNFTKPSGVVSQSDYDALANYRDWAETRRAKDHARLVKLDMQLGEVLEVRTVDDFVKVKGKIRVLLAEDYLGSFITYGGDL